MLFVTMFLTSPLDVAVGLLSILRGIFTTF